MTSKASGNGECNYKSGPLPGCAPLAMAYVPMQQAAEPTYGVNDALARGTLFPGLDLPFMNMINTPPEMTTPLRELMALCFVLDELVLYLDTHPLDTEAFALWKELSKLEREGWARYTALCGPLTHADLAYQESFSWLENPWPWDADPAAEG